MQFSPASIAATLRKAVERIGALELVAGTAALTLATGIGVAVFSASGDTPAATAPAMTGPLAASEQSCGRVVDTVTLEPLGGVEVAIVSVTDPGMDRFVPQAVSSTTSADDGSWCLGASGVSDWSVFVDGSALGYEVGFPSVWDATTGAPDDTIGWSYVDSWQRAFQVGEGDRAVDVGELRLDRVDPSCGRVVDGTNLAPLAAVRVTMIDVDEAGDTADGRPSSPPVGPDRLTTVTRPDGTWCITAAGVDDWSIFVDGSAVGYEVGYLGYAGAAPTTDHFEVDSWANGVQLGELNTTLDVGDVHLDPAGPTTSCGRVLDATTLAPLVGVGLAAVDVRDAARTDLDAPIATTTSAADGTWCLDIVTDADWTIHVDGIGVGYEAGYPGFYDADTGTIRITDHYEIDTWDRGIQLGEGSAPVEVGDLHLDRLAVTCGRVLDAVTLTPLVGVSVSAITVADASGGRTDEPITATTTAPDGRWCLTVVTEADWTIRIDGSAIAYEQGHPTLFDAATGRVEARDHYLVDSWDNGFQVGEGTMGIELGDVHLDRLAALSSTTVAVATTSTTTTTPGTTPATTTPATTTPATTTPATTTPTTTPGTTPATTTPATTTPTTIAPADPRITSLTSGIGPVPLPTECATKVWITVSTTDPNGGPLTVRASWTGAGLSGQTTVADRQPGTLRLGVASFDYRFRGEAITITVLVTDATGRTDQAELRLTGDYSGGSCPSSYG